MNAENLLDCVRDWLMPPRSLEAGKSSGSEQDSFNLAHPTALAIELDTSAALENTAVIFFVGWRSMGWALFPAIGRINHTSVSWAATALAACHWLQSPEGKKCKRLDPLQFSLQCRNVTWSTARKWLKKWRARPDSNWRPSA
jgi:hypothetical protein